MPLLKAEAAKLSNNDLVAGVIEEMIERDQTFAMVPFVETMGKAYVYNREDESDMDDHITGSVATAGVSFLDPNDTVLERGTKFVEVTTNLRIIAGDVDVDKFLSGTMSDTTSQLAAQIAAKAKIVGSIWKRTFVNGDNGTNAKEFDGINQLVTAGQTIATATDGVALTFEKLDELKDLVPNGADALIMHSVTYRAFKALVRALYGTAPEHIMYQDFGMVPSYDGTPILINDFLSITETQGTASGNCTSVYAVRFYRRAPVIAPP